MPIVWKSGRINPLEPPGLVEGLRFSTSTEAMERSLKG